MSLPAQSIFAGAAPVRRASVVASPGGAGERGARAFTLIEMLVVLGIIGVLAAMTLPSFTKAGKGNITETASRQLMDDLAYARLKAMSGRSRVYLVFMPPQSYVLNTTFHPLAADLATNVTYFTNNPSGNAVLGGQMVSYALFVRRAAGEQPGQETPRYLTEWRSLPAGVFIPRETFTNHVNAATRVFGNVNRYLFVTNTAADYWFPMDDTSAGMALTNLLPFIAFDPDGRVYGRNTDLVIPLMEGSLVSTTDMNTHTTNLVADVDAVVTAPPVPSGGIILGVEYYVSGSGSVEYPPSSGSFYRPGDTFVGTANPNYTPTGTPRVVPLYGVRVNWITGRAKVVRPELP